MHFFRDDALLRRAVGAALVLGLLGLAARQWREDSASGVGGGGDYSAANNWMHTCWVLAVLALVYVAVCLLLTPRSRRVEADENATNPM